MGHAVVVDNYLYIYIYFFFPPDFVNNTASMTSALRRRSSGM